MLQAGSNIKAQDSTRPWFPGGEDGFYDYLNSRLLSQGSQRIGVPIQGENVAFEFVVSDSGWIDSVNIGFCFNVQLGITLNRILCTMPRVNAEVSNGKTVAVRRVFSLVIKPGIGGYSIEPNNINYQPISRVNKPVKLVTAMAAIVLLLLFVFN